MTKGELIYLLRNSLVGDTPTQEAGVRFSEPQLLQALSVNYEALVRQEYKGNPTQLDPYTKRYNATVAIDNQGIGRFSIFVAIGVTSIMNVGGFAGVRSIGSTTLPEGDTFNVYNKVDFDMMPALIRSDVGVIGGESWWWQDGETVYLVRFDPGVIQVQLACLVNLDEYNFDENVMMPAGRADLLIEMAKKTVLEGLPPDQDGSDTQTVKTK